MSSIVRPPTPAWAETSEDSVVTINGRERDVVDHYGSVARVPFPGHAPKGGELPYLDIDVSRCDVVDANDDTRVHVGAYLVTVGTNVTMPESVLSSIDDLEQFAHALLATTHTLRRFLADEAGTLATTNAAEEEDDE